MKIKRIKMLANETFKTVNELNPNFVKAIFTSKFFLIILYLLFCNFYKIIPY